MTIPKWGKQLGVEPWDDVIKLDLFLSPQTVHTRTVRLQAAVLNIALTSPRVGPVPDLSPPWTVVSQQGLFLGEEQTLITFRCSGVLWPRRRDEMRRKSQTKAASDPPWSAEPYLALVQPSPGPWVDGPCRGNTGLLGLKSPRTGSSSEVEEYVSVDAYFTSHQVQYSQKGTLLSVPLKPSSSRRQEAQLPLTAFPRNEEQGTH